MSAFLFLWLETNPSDAEAAQATLKAGGIDCEVVWVDSRADFITALETNTFDLILSNFAVPDFEGMAVLEVVQNLHPEIPLIFVSASVGEEKAIAAFEAGAAGFVLKHQLQHLVPCVQRALRKVEEYHNRKRTELVGIEQQSLLELIATGCPLEECLTAVCASLFRLNPNVRACFLLADTQRLTFCHSITPDFPPSLNQKLKGLPINDLCIGTCGEAVYRGEPISCADIASDHRWSPQWREVCLAHGVRACHSEPVMGLKGLPLGSLMLCFNEARMPTEWEYQLADFGTRIASIVFERDRTDLALHESEAKYRSLFESIDEGFCICEMLFDEHGEPQDYRFLEVNSVFEPLTGLQQVVGKTARELVPNLESFWFKIYGSVVQTGKAVRFEQQSVAMNRWFDVNAFCIGDPQSRQFGILFTNITERKKVEQERERFLALGSDLQVITGNNGYFRWVSPSFEETLGWTQTEMTSHTWTEFVHPDDINSSVAETASLFSGHETFRFENRYRHKDGSYRWLLWNAQPHLEEQVIYGAAIDITERKQAEAEREQLLQREQAAREEAERANRIKDEFLAVLSHELRSPLNPILGWTRLLQTGKLDAARQREALATIERNAKLQTQLIEDLLDISRIMQGKLSLTVASVSLTFVITAAVETVRLAAEAKNIAVVLDLGRLVAPVAGDATRLQQVVWNLLMNAVKFTPNGGQVTVELRQLDGLAQIRVIDTGKGISREFLPHVFEYFRQADSTTTRQFGGLGLGLALVRQIVEMHGGTVKAESLGENQGATFTVQLPVIRQATSTISELPQTKAENPAAPLSNLQILVVDDDADTREFQAFLLQQSGARVIAVASGLEALQVLEQSIPDVLVSDVGMAEMDGYMLLQQIRSRPPHRGGTIPAIAVTAYAMDFDQQKVLQSGFQAHITKPVESEMLVKAIINLLEQN